MIKTKLRSYFSMRRSLCRFFGRVPTRNCGGVDVESWRLIVEIWNFKGGNENGTGSSELGFTSQPESLRVV